MRGTAKIRSRLMEPKTMTMGLFIIKIRRGYSIATFQFGRFH